VLGIDSFLTTAQFGFGVFLVEELSLRRLTDIGVVGIGRGLGLHRVGFVMSCAGKVNYSPASAT
jgi:hypothetical protein